MRNIGRKYILLLAIVLCSTSAWEQPSRIDVLKNNINQAKDQPTKLAAVMALCEQWDSYSPDTLYRYASMAKQLATNQKNSRSIHVADFYLAAYLFQKNELDSALKLTVQTFAQYKKDIPYDDMYARYYRLQGNIYLRQTHYDEGLKMNLEMLKLTEEQKDSLGMAFATIGIGNVHKKLQKQEVALGWYQKALRYLQSDSLKRKLSFLYNNIAITYYNLDREDSMFYFIKLGLKYSQESGNLTDYANALFLNGGMLAETKQLEAAETYFKMGLEERKQIGDIYYLISDMAQLALFYLNSNQPQKGIDICLEGLQLASTSRYSNVDDLYQSLARNYKAAGQYQKAAETLEQFIIFKDSIYTRNSAEALAKLQAMYELQKKENTIIQQKYDLSKKNYLIYGAIGLLAATFLFGYFFFKDRKKNQRLRMQAFEMEQKKKTTKAVMEAEEVERKRIAGDLHDSVAQKMVVAKLNLDALGNQLKNLDPSQQEIYNNIHSLLDESSAEVRGLSHSMMPQVLERSGLTDAVKDFLDKISVQDLWIGFHSEGDFKTVDDNTSLMIYRIVQECVQNVLKHAAATKLYVAMISGNQELDITIEDNGKGFDAKRPGSGDSTGLKNIRSRTAYLTGEIEIDSQPGKGTVIALYIPINKT